MNKKLRYSQNTTNFTKRNCAPYDLRFTSFNWERDKYFKSLKTGNKTISARYCAGRNGIKKPQLMGVRI